MSAAAICATNRSRAVFSLIHTVSTTLRVIPDWRDNNRITARLSHIAVYEVTMSKDWRAKIGLGRGDLAGANGDAIVNAANSALMLGGGVGGAIRVRGGP